MLDAIQFLAEGMRPRDVVWLFTTESGTCDYGELTVCMCLAGRNVAAESGGKRSHFKMQFEKGVALDVGT
jgi:hypothetical protein